MLGVGPNSQGCACCTLEAPSPPPRQPSPMALWMSFTTALSRSCCEAFLLAGGAWDSGEGPGGQASEAERNCSRSSKELSLSCKASTGSWPGGLPRPWSSMRGVLERLWQRFSLLFSCTENMECRLWEERSRRPPSGASARKASASSEEERDRPREALLAARTSAVLRLTSG